ncbi:exosome complex exonuclease [Sarcoptes scabiei]|nr:exosome complex exonuclease [Sarcoptes scabiei]
MLCKLYKRKSKLSVIFNQCGSFSNISKEWMRRHLKDSYVKQSRYQNYRSRAAFKLIEIDDKYNLLKPGMIVLECGAAPGSWTQVFVERLKLSPPGQQKTGAVIALDRSDFASVAGAICLPKTDFTSQLSQARILEALNERKIDLIASDMAPNVTGQHDLDHERILSLVKAVIRFATISLKPSGHLLAKLFNGRETDSLLRSLSDSFELVKIVKPPASRVDSTESYILCKNYQKPADSQEAYD